MVDTLLILGPFLAGVREGFVDYLYPPMKEYRSPITHVPIRWKPVVADTDGYFRISVDTQNLKLLNEEHGLAGVNLLFYVKGIVKVDTPGVYLIRGKHVGSLKVGKRRYTLNYYGDYEGLVPLNGKDTVLFAVGGLGGVRPFKIEVRKAPDTPFVYMEDLTLPDLLRGEAFNGYVGITVANPTLKPVKVRINGRPYNLEPLSFLKVPVEIHVKAPRKGDSVKVRFYFNGRPFAIKLAVKGTNAPYVRRTYLSSVDSSVQYYAVKFPVKFNPRKRYGLVLSLHGAAVRAENRCRNHKPRKKEIVVCPTNRRRWGFDWEDWGRVDALEVLEEVQRNFKVDRRRIFLMGTSMGGHGVWHLCTSYPSVWKACMPAAAWLSIDLYIPTHLQRYRLFGKTPFVEIQERLYQQARTTQLFKNLLNVPVVILQGGKDDNVPPFHARLASDLLSRLGATFRLVWRADRGHWWDGSLDDPDLWKWAYRLKVKRKERYFYTYDLSVSDSAYGVKILEVRSPFYRAGFVIRRRRGKLFITTENVRALVIPGYRGKVTIDGDTLKYDGEVLVKYRRWRKMKRYVYRRPVLIRDVFMRPFVFVYSTSEPWARDVAVFYANAWWSYANGRAPVLPDTAITERWVKSNDLNVVVIGSRAKLPPFLSNPYSRARENAVEVVPLTYDRLLLTYKVSDTSLVPLLYSLVPSSIRSVRAMPSWVGLRKEARMYGIHALEGGLKFRAGIWPIRR